MVDETPGDNPVTRGVLFVTEGQITVGVDVGSHMHRVAIGIPEKKIAEEFDLPHNKEGFENFFARISYYEKTYQVPVVVAMEGFNGYARPLDKMIQKKGYRLLNVNNLKLCRFKEIFPSPAKTDAIEARKILELVRLQPLLSYQEVICHQHPYYGAKFTSRFPHMDTFLR